ncbi:MAG: hypothetical protein AAF993_13250 [Pseudomonadota bacterium]
MKKLIYCALLCAFSASVFAEQPPLVADEKSVEVPKLETRIIKVDPCRDSDCEPAYRLPPEQLEQLRDLNAQAPGEVIHMAPPTGQETPPARGF